MGKYFFQTEEPEEAVKIYFENYDNIYGRLKVKNIQQVIAKAITSWPDFKVLEAGCAGGIYTKFFVDKGADVTCVDICEPILKGNMKLNPRARHVLADASQINFREKFDLVFAVDVIEHIKDDMLFLSNMNKNLKNGGLILINTQNSFSFNYLLEGGINFLKGNRAWCGWDPGHVRFYNPISLKQKLLINGFKPLKWFGNYHATYLFTKIFGKTEGSKLAHIVEILNWQNNFPFSITGWGIGVLARKAKEA